MSQHLMEITDLGIEQLEYLIDETIAFKENPHKDPKALANKIVRLVFDSNSLRTRVSFETAVDLMGGKHYFHDIRDLVMEKDETPREDLKDIIINLDGFLTDIYVVRDYSQKLLDVARKESIKPIINGFSVVGHPSQALADLAAIKDKKGTLHRLDYTAIVPHCGSGVVESFVYAALMLGQVITLITPTGRFRGKNQNFWEKVEELQNRYGGKVNVTQDTGTVRKADVLYVDEWWKPLRDFHKIAIPEGYQVNIGLLRDAKKGLVVMHCQPAHRGREITSEVMDGVNSIISLQSEYRLYSAMSLLNYVVDNVKN